MSQTILQYLTTPNLNLSVEVSGPTYTTHDAWAPVESIQPWPDFTYDILVNRFRDVLRLSIDPFNYVSAFENAQLNIITSEPSFDIALAGNIAKVSSALHKVKKSLFLGGGSRIIKDQSWGRPDWGAGDSTIGYAARPDICQGILCGDTKVLWDPREASKFVNDKREHYERLTSRRNTVSPFEQVQHYCQQWGTRYGFIITDKSLVVVRLKLSPPSPSQRQLRQLRDTQSSGHKRILSDASTMTDVSETFSAMSFEPPYDEQDIGGLEVATIPWDHGKGKVVTVDLALFLLVLLAETERHLSDHYDHLDKGEEIRVPAMPTQPDKRQRESGSQRKPNTEPTEDTEVDWFRNVRPWRLYPQGCHICRH